MDKQENYSRMEEEYYEHTARSIRDSQYLDRKIFDNGIAWEGIKGRAGRPELVFRDCGSVDALFETKGHVMILDFASFTTPGGNYMSVDGGQEDALCRESNLYNILELSDEFYEKNRNAIHCGLYKDRCLLIPDVVFVRGEEERFADVIVCSAPSKKIFRKYWMQAEAGKIAEEFDFQMSKNFDMDEILSSTIQNRIGFLRRVVDMSGRGDVDCLILGAWGCGMCGNDPFTVAKLMEANFYKTTTKKIIYAVPEENKKNNEMFCQIFE